MTGRSGDQWRDPGSPEHSIMSRAAIALKAIWVVVCRSNTGYFVSAFADVVGRASANVPEDEFEKDMRSLVEGIRMSRADEQSVKAVKS